MRRGAHRRCVGVGHACCLGVGWSDSGARIWSSVLWVATGGRRHAIVPGAPLPTVLYFILDPVIGADADDKAGTIERTGILSFWSPLPSTSISSASDTART